MSERLEPRDPGDPGQPSGRQPSGRQTSDRQASGRQPSGDQHTGDQRTGGGPSPQESPLIQRLKGLEGELDPTTLAAQIAAVAGHLQRTGVHWLPRPHEETAQRLHAQLAHAAAPSAIASAAEPQVDPSPGSPQAGMGSPADNAAVSVTIPPASADRPKTAPVLRAAGGADPGTNRYPGVSLTADERQQRLDQLRELVSVCTRCEVLARCRSQTVFGEGSVTPRVVFFGEGPGAEEDRSGRPFVGAAGQLLTKMIEACTFRRSDVYILNTVKCRPPGNRNPEPEELNHCREYYQQQLALLRPEYIVCLGAISSQELLQSKLPVGQLRGKLHRYLESKVLVTYHPAYLLRNPSAKKAAWEDLQLMLRDAGIKY